MSYCGRLNDKNTIFEVSKKNILKNIQKRNFLVKRTSRKTTQRTKFFDY